MLELSDAPTAPERTASANAPAPSRPRIGIIDLTRGLAVAFMALDHTRDYFTNLTFDPENLSHTWPALFVVRWVTHFCAPAFFLLMGIGAFLYGKKAGDAKLSVFLATRGLWLILLEFTIVGFAWTLIPGWGMFGVIWALGASMLILACLVQVPWQALLGIAVCVITTHDLFDSMSPASSTGAIPALYSILHHSGNIVLFGRSAFVLFPLIPWCAVTVLGFSMGVVFLKPEAVRSRLLLRVGLGAIAAFVFLRLTNLYGNPVPPYANVSPGDFHLQNTLGRTAILFFDVEKYPPSLQYLLMTLGPIFVLLSLPFKSPTNMISRGLVTFGRTPLVFYILHLYVIHLAAIVVAAVDRQPVHWLLHGAFFINDLPRGYGHGLLFIVAAWLCVLCIVYPFCVWYDRAKQTNRWAWTKFV
jgi:uncharacterized membrane protein